MHFSEEQKYSSFSKRDNKAFKTFNNQFYNLISKMNEIYAWNLNKYIFLHVPNIFNIFNSDYYRVHLDFDISEILHLMNKEFSICIFIEMNFCELFSNLWNCYKSIFICINVFGFFSSKDNINVLESRFYGQIILIL